MTGRRRPRRMASAGGGPPAGPPASEAALTAAFVVRTMDQNPGAFDDLGQPQAHAVEQLLDALLRCALVNPQDYVRVTARLPAEAALDAYTAGIFGRVKRLGLQPPQHGDAAPAAAHETDE